MAKALTQEARLGKQCYDKARDQFGSGWNLMTPEIKEMAVSAQVLNIFYAQTETGANTVEWVNRVFILAPCLISQQGCGDIPDHGRQHGNSRRIALRQETWKPCPYVKENHVNSDKTAGTR